MTRVCTTGVDARCAAMLRTLHHQVSSTGRRLSIPGETRGSQHGAVFVVSVGALRVRQRTLPGAPTLCRYDAALRGRYNLLVFRPVTACCGQGYR